jgi:hypothetical protein
VDATRLQVLSSFGIAAEKRPSKIATANSQLSRKKKPCEQLRADRRVMKNGAVHTPVQDTRFTAGYRASE